MFTSFVIFSLLSVAVVHGSKFYQEKVNSKRYSLKKRSLQSNNNNESFTLDMDCDGLESAACLNYMQNYLYDYIKVNKSYSSQNVPSLKPYNDITPPTSPDQYSSVDAEVWITFGDLLDVNIITGTMTMSLFIDILWTDQLLNWDATKTQNKSELIVPLDLIWLPDIVLYNAIGGYKTALEPVAIFFYSDGEVWYSAKGVVSVACTYDLQKFPFDSQTCYPGT